MQGTRSHIWHIQNRRKWKKIEVGRAVQVAFIISGCNFATCNKVLYHSLGIRAPMEVIGSSKQYTIVEEMVDEMWKEAMLDIKQEELGSWSRAVTTADRVWMTRGYHSKCTSWVLFSSRDTSAKRAQTQ